MFSIAQRIAEEISAQQQHVNAVIELLDDGATVPFIARYRKELTGAMDDNQLRTLHERLGYLRELDDRRETVLKSIEEQDKLTPELKKSILEAQTKTQLEDLYLPYKPKRRTKAQIAIEAGLEPLADLLFEKPETNPELEAEKYIDSDKGVEDIKAALEGARNILMERFAEDAQLLEKLRSYMRDNASLIVKLADDSKKQEAEKFTDYFDYSETFKTVPSHRMLAALRGRNETFLRVNVDIERDEEAAKLMHPCENIINAHLNFKHQDRPADDFLAQVMRWTWQVKLNYQIESDLITEKRQEAELEAIKVFSHNLKDLLLAAPAGPKTTLGLDPGFRSGVKVAVVDSSGKILDHCAIYPHQPQQQWDQALATIAALCAKHKVQLVSIGNGTASRETDALVIEMIKKHPELKLQKIVVNEAGASVYSASEFAAKEFPDLDVTIRGAISIARRLQDPLAELVKIEPKAIGVGQYQHDVNQVQLNKSLDAVVEDCVNAVGVDLNTASEPLLTRVSGLSASTANNIVNFRQQHGRFKNRQQLLEVSRLGPKIFEQAAGFLRINNGDNPLDASSVHPESYSIVEKIAQQNSLELENVIANHALLKTIQIKDYINNDIGEMTLKDIINELEKPGRDPRPEFKTATFKEGVEKISDLKPGMRLEGVVTNVANFGAFIDVGVHQDGLVHISALSDTFVKDPRTVVKAGDIVMVKVMEVDPQRKRISLSMRLDDELNPDGDKANGSPKTRHAANNNSSSRKRNSNQGRSQSSTSKQAPQGAMASALMDALKNKK